MKDFGYSDSAYLHSFMKTAQYLANLTTYEDVWKHIAEVMVTFHGAEWAGFARRGAGLPIEFHHLVPPDASFYKLLYAEEIQESIYEVLDSGFISWRSLDLGKKIYTIVILPIKLSSETAGVMIVGHDTAGPISNDILNVYLSVAGLAGATITRLVSEAELKERTAELLSVNEHLKTEMEQRKLIQRDTEATNSILRLMSDTSGKKDFLDGAVSLLRKWTGCGCAGIRLVDDGNYIPYVSHEGFSNDFLEQESYLSLEKDSCMCLKAVLGRFEPLELRYLTEGGSFILNDSGKFVESLSAENRKLLRGRCIDEGYRSIALTPIRDTGDIIGLIHLADKSEGLFSSLQTSLLERLAELIGEGIRKFKIQETILSYMAKLEALNRDLQDFAFIASHDLREPLRKIQAFGTMLKSNCGKQLGEKAGEYLNRMINAAGRMDELIQALTRYSRIARNSNPFAPTDLSDVVRMAISDIEFAVKRAGATIEVGALPRADVDSVQMRQVFQNLIANSLKYQRAGNKPVIKIRSKVDNNLCQIFVEDNGIGFEEIHLDKIFKPFERLHGRTSAYEGTGMGLAICRKIVERHGGKITAESTPGEGSSFIVTLPIRQPGPSK